MNNYTGVSRMNSKICWWLAMLELLALITSVVMLWVGLVLPSHSYECTLAVITMLLLVIVIEITQLK